ncbi:protein of unknown function [Xenorhabdus bovienii]|uniref:Uncharacterized protein n=1 Tax=Xenorhabdus bovienii TaxID=40576 RepID=A0A0B6X8V8_XENBV|nr:protein of unknown function [Xenorhabdus bovienii]
MLKLGDPYITPMGKYIAEKIE